MPRALACQCGSSLHVARAAVRGAALSATLLLELLLQTAPTKPCSGYATAWEMNEGDLRQVSHVFVVL